MIMGVSMDILGNLDASIIFFLYREKKKKSHFVYKLNSWVF